MKNISKLFLLVSALTLCCATIAATAPAKIELGQYFAAPQQSADISLDKLLAHVNYDISCYIRGSDLSEEMLVKPNVNCYSINGQPRCSDNAFKIPAGPEGSVMFMTKMSKQGLPFPDSLSFLNLDDKNQLIVACSATPSSD